MRYASAARANGKVCTDHCQLDGGRSDAARTTVDEQGVAGLDVEQAKTALCSLTGYGTGHLGRRCPNYVAGLLGRPGPRRCTQHDANKVITVNIEVTSARPGWAAGRNGSVLCRGKQAQRDEHPCLVGEVADQHSHGKR